MTPVPAPLLGLIALAIVAFVFVLWGASVKLRAASGRGRGVRVYDLGADLELSSRLQARSYQIALYLTMKSRARDAAQSAVISRVASP